jgi:CDP-6-deoxy-D-xylo-4-hexulose-3-dehydrase
VIPALIPLSIPLMRDTFARQRETLHALSDWLASMIANPTKLSMGPLCAEFEREFAAWQSNSSGRKHAVLTNSGASANLILIQSLLNLGRLKKGQRVGVSALTWATNVTPLIQLGLVPVAIDIDPCTLNVTSKMLIPHLDDIDALFITNALGFLPNLQAIQLLCEDADILLLEDNCESLGSELPSGKAGNFGLAATFSFFVAHHMSTIEGGMVCTDDDDLAEMLVMVRANGWDRNLTPDQQAKWRTKYSIESEFDAKYTFYVPSFNVRPTEITGFLGLKQLDALDAALAERWQRFEALEAVARGNGDFVELDHAHMTRLSPFAFPVLCRTRELRDEYVRQFEAAGVEMRPIIAGNLASQPFFQPFADGVYLPGALTVDECGFYFGIYPELTPDDMDVLTRCLQPL